MRVLVTGAAGFIGAHVCRHLLAKGWQVAALDNFNDYYDVALKHARQSWLQQHFSDFAIQNLDICDAEALNALVQAHRPEVIIHLAAQAGVRFSLEAPEQYVQANLVGFANVLEAARHSDVDHLVYASSSSVYGNPTGGARQVDEPADRQVSLYAATKRSNELLAHSYSHLYGFATTGLRFFTVYGPFGRPDMAPWLFSDAILAGRPIKVFNHGNMARDFTYIDDIVVGVERIAAKAPSQPYRLFNLGNGQPETLMQFISQLELQLGQDAMKTYLDMQPGDVQSTHADMSAFRAEYGDWHPTSLEQGLVHWAKWFRDFAGR